MRLQVNTTLALYSVMEFAADPQRHIPAAEIAEKYGVSPHHLAKVLAELARAGIVESARGVGGGYRFAANVRRMTLMDVIQLFEDFAPPASHRRDGDAGGRRRPALPRRAMRQRLSGRYDPVCGHEHAPERGPPHPRRASFGAVDAVKASIPLAPFEKPAQPTRMKVGARPDGIGCAPEGLPAEQRN